MISRTKYRLDDSTIRKLFEAAEIPGVTDIAPLGAGEFNAVYSVRTPDKEYALKVAPGTGAPILTYEKDMMAAEVFWYQRMREHSSIHVPEIHRADFSRTILPAPYFIMDKVVGKQMDQMDFSPTEKEEAMAETARMVSQIHRIKNDRFGYVQNGLFGDWYQAIRSMIVNLIADAEKKHRKTNRGKLLLSYVDHYRSLLEKADCCMVNFDIWPPNILCQREKDGSIQYHWLDPERSFWGDRIVDFVCLETLTPLPEKKRTLAAYNAVAEHPVLATPQEQIRYSIALGYLALIMEVEKYYRYSPFHFGWWRNVGASSLFFSRAFETLKNG